MRILTFDLRSKVISLISKLLNTRNSPQFPIHFTETRAALYVNPLLYKLIWPDYDSILCFFIESIDLVFEHLGHDWSPQFEGGTWRKTFNSGINDWLVNAILRVHIKSRCLWTFVASCAVIWWIAHTFYLLSNIS